MRLSMHTIILALFFSGCKPNSGSSLGALSTAAISVPREIHAVKQRSSTGFKLDGETGTPDAKPEWICKVINGQQYCGTPDTIAQVEAGTWGKDNGNATPANSFLDPVADLSADKWFTGNRDSYYQPVTNIPGFMQNFDSQGKPTGVFLNSETNQLIRFNSGGFDAGTKLPAFTAQDQIWDRDPAFTQGYRGLEQRWVDGKLVPTGQDFYYGNIQQQNAAQLTPGWGHVYGVNVDQYLQANGESALAQYIRTNNLTGNILLGQSPLSYTEGNLNILQPSILSDLWVPNSPAGLPGGASSQVDASAAAAAAAAAKSTQLTVMKVSAFECVNCPSWEERNAMRRQGIPVIVVSMNQNNPWGVTSYPNAVTIPANQIPPQAFQMETDPRQ